MAALTSTFLCRRLLHSFSRSNSLRSNEHQLKTLALEQAVKFLVLSQDLKLPIDFSLKREARLKWLSKDELDKFLPDHSIEKAIFLGQGKEVADSSDTLFFAVGSEIDTQELRFDHGKWLDVRSAYSVLYNPKEVGVISMARGLFHFHSKNQFCPNCGHKTELKAGGAQRLCLNCNNTIYPRSDPVVISLIHRGEECLLARQPQFPPKFYSCLAGFIEVGETIAEGLAREVLEEVGVKVKEASIRIVESQSWPFPSSLMIGCEASTDEEQLQIDKTELEDARWITRQEVKQLLEESKGKSMRDFKEEQSQPVQLPPHFTIAHRLLKRWAFAN